MNGKNENDRKFGKKWLCGLLCIAILCGLTACGSQNHKEQEVDSDTFEVEFESDSEDGPEIGVIRLEYYLGDEEIGGGAISYAAPPMFARDERIVWEFVKDDFPEDANLSDFGLQVTVTDESGEIAYPCESNGIIRIDAQYGNSYKILISGGFEDGFTAKLVE